MSTGHPSNPKRDTRERVRQLTDAGLEPRAIAQVLGISTQRVYQHLKALELGPDGEREVSA